MLFWGALALGALVIVAIATDRGTAEQMIPVVVGAVYASTGRMLLKRQPGNAVGWIIAVVGVVTPLAGLTSGYLASHPASDPRLAYQLVAWIDMMTWNLWFPFLVTIALPLHFPDGHPPSPRWRWVIWGGLGGTALSMIGYGLAPGDLEVPVANPFGIAGAGAALNAVAQIGFWITTVCSFGALASVVVRLRRARGVERQQVKWFAYVIGVAIASLTLAGFASVNETTDVVAPVGWFTALALIGFGLPVATAFAVLRHRLYDIDVVIKRTLVYGALTATLGGAYVGSVLLLQLLLSPSSDLAIAGSTLAVAALFRPVRTRIQELVNRRFYRSDYDAAQTVERFSARTRDEVSLEALSEELRAVVMQTMQPSHVSVWLR